MPLSALEGQGMSVLGKPSQEDAPGSGAALLWRQAGRAGGAQPREGSKETCQHLKGANKKDGDRDFSGTCCNGTRAAGFALK